jgi:hypothetical protein
MALWNIVPSWFEIEDRTTHNMGYQADVHEYSSMTSQAATVRRIATI